MKISELTQIPSVSRDIRIPISIANQNMSVSVGQLLDTMSLAIVPFHGIDHPESEPVVAVGTTSAPLPIVYDTAGERFVACLRNTASNAGITTESTVYFTEWNGSDAFYEDGAVRTSCLFLAADGRLYWHDGTTLRSAGVTEEQARRIELCTPIEVPDEETMELMIENGDVVEGQWYFVAETE